MQQSRILELLQEASTTTDKTRRDNILIELQEAAPVPNIPHEPANLLQLEYKYQKGRCDEIRQMILRIFVNTLIECPEHLPTLFPFFALCCGDRKEGAMCADIEWSLLAK